MSWLVDRVKVVGFQGYRSIDIRLRKEPNFFIGVNGSGKTTFIELLSSALEIDNAGLLRAPFEEIEIDFKDLYSRKKPSLRLHKPHAEGRRPRTILGEIRVSQTEEPLTFVASDETFFFPPHVTRVGGADDELREVSSPARAQEARKILSQYLSNSWLLTQPPDPGRLFGDSVRLSFWLGVGGQGPLSGALA